jgi:hypothetical protein
MIRDDAMHDREAEAGALTSPFCGEEGIKNLFQELGRDSIAGVLDDQPQVQPWL